ncbi:MAG: glucose-1-phosphate thymidylyltransferase [Rhodospirillaceae bacterium]|nr:glucose-1-phosphate thymidylyltransferase [Rhodospirillaceae bacterium]
MRGLILAGGSGSRLYPSTLATSKQLLPIYDKPMIYYPLSTLMFAGIRDILLIAKPSDIPNFQVLLGDGSQWGVNLNYCEQAQPRGLADAFIIGRNFVDNAPCSLILGDNIFYGHGLINYLTKAASLSSGAMGFAHPVENPGEYGVISFDINAQPLTIEEKPNKPRSRWALTGLYFYDAEVCHIAQSLKPSERGELEITDINNCYLRKNKLQVIQLGRGFSWFDAGTADSLLEASNFVQTLEKRQGLKICCPEEAAFRMGFIDEEQLEKTASAIRSPHYRYYVEQIVSGKISE